MALLCSRVHVDNRRRAVRYKSTRIRRSHPHKGYETLNGELQLLSLIGAPAE